MLDARTLLSKLHAADVAFVVVGGLAAVAHGSAHVTGDLDVCYDRAPANLERLATALSDSIHACAICLPVFRLHLMRGRYATVAYSR